MHPLDQTTTEQRLARIETWLEAESRFNNERFTSQDKAVRAALEAAKEANGKAERATELRFESVNEFRKTLGDQAGNFITRATFEEFQKSLRLNLREDHGDVRAVWALIISAVTAIVFAISVFIKHS
jgi:hypothetical protein